jgi:hypothetical protein
MLCSCPINAVQILQTLLRWCTVAAHMVPRRSLTDAQSLLSKRLEDAAQMP